MTLTDELKRRPHGAALVAALLLASMGLALPGCWGGDDTTAIDISETDPDIVLARQNARSTLNQFIYALENPRAGQTLFAVKAKFVDGQAVEYMWLTDLSYENGTFIGVVNNEPTIVSNIRLGQQYSVSAYEIDDWMILENDQIVGGYSVEVVAARQAPETTLR